MIYLKKEKIFKSTCIHCTNAIISKDIGSVILNQRLANKFSEKEGQSDCCSTVTEILDYLIRQRQYKQ